MKIAYEDTFKTALSGGLNLFVGAGFSVLAKNRDKVSLPIGSALVDELKGQFESVKDLELQLPQLCTVLEKTNKIELKEFLVRRFTVGEYDPRYHVLDLLNVKNIFSTNIDNLVSEIFEKSSHKYLNDLDLQGSYSSDQNAVDIVNLHGSVLNSQRPMRFSVPDLSSAFRKDSDKWYYLANRLRAYPTLFWGYSLSDAGTLEALDTAAESDRLGSKSPQDRWITLSPRSSTDPGIVAYYEAMGFNIIEADTEDLLDYLNNIIRTPASPKAETRIRDTRLLFPQEAIPKRENVASRPIINFFLGSPPTWSDIFSGNIGRTSHFHKAKDVINSGRHIALVGTPACGKTTILMQLAQEFLGKDSHVLMCDSISREKAVFIDGRLAGEKALVFLDNFTDSLDAANYLSSVPTVQVVGAAPYYNFSMVRNGIDGIRSGSLEVCEVSELSLMDIQLCIEKIPKDIRAVTTRQIALERGHNNSLFEVIEQNISQPTLKERFKSLAGNLRENDPSLLSLFLMFSYVDSCRTPVSMDMIFAYLRDVTHDHNVMYSMIDSLGRLVKEYWGSILASEFNQDLFSVRSTLVSDAVVNAASGTELREMLEKFHENVSPIRIFRYDVFKRYAYDSRLMLKAFDSWEAGMDFYERLFWRDDSPFLLQQCALFLSKKERHIEAFEMIDRANTQSGGKIWSIRNSHAIIVFYANKRHFRNPDARVALEGSMEELALCYKWDNRRPFHAQRYAEQAIDFWHFYHDEVANEYLNNAHEWLLDEVARSPWDRKSRDLLLQLAHLLKI